MFLAYFFLLSFYTQNTNMIKQRWIMLKEILPNFLYESLSKIPLDKITEIRLRVGSLMSVRVDGMSLFVTSSGLSKTQGEGFVIKSCNLDYILQKISNNSRYSINDQLINGYVTFGGMRIGVCGEVVTNENKISTVKNITSLNIRVPHIIKNCSLQVYAYLVEGGIKNTLVISPPGAGKTTFIRDFACQLRMREHNPNILIVDERSEITSIIDDSIFAGIDIIKNCTKKYAFTNGIRSMAPDVIITDEIDVEKDLDAIQNAMTSGVKVVATLHAKDTNDLKNKAAFNEMLRREMWERVVVIGTSNGVGTIEGVYNQHLRCVYM